MQHLLLHWVLSQHHYRHYRLGHKTLPTRFVWTGFRMKSATTSPPYSSYSGEGEDDLADDLDEEVDLGSGFGFGEEEDATTASAPAAHESNFTHVFTVPIAQIHPRWCVEDMQKLYDTNIFITELG